MKKNKVKQNKSNMFNADMKEIRVRILERKEQVALENFLQEKDMYTSMIYPNLC